jgi:uncharacterized protein YndB with AHSA1/START domain
MPAFKPVVTVEKRIRASAREVWDVLTHKSGVMFMGAEVNTDWNEGHPITFSGNWKGKPYCDKGVVQTFERNRELAFTHFSPLSGKPDVPENYNLVSITLEIEDDSSTKLKLTQSIADNAAEPSPDTLAEFEKNWEAMVEKLKQECER